MAPLTGTDIRALDAAVHLICLYQDPTDRDILEAFRIVVSRMQPGTQELAYHAIAYIHNWDDRPRLWRAAGLAFPPELHSCLGE